MIVMTTNSSNKVKPALGLLFCDFTVYLPKSGYAPPTAIRSIHRFVYTFTIERQ